MIYLLYGEDAFSIGEALKALKSQVEPLYLRDVNTTIINASDASFEAVTSACSTVPFLAERRLVIVESLLSKFERQRPPQTRGSATRKTDSVALGKWSELSRYISKMPESTDLVFVDARVSNSNTLMRSIQPHAKILNFPLPNPSQLKEWILKRASVEGLKMEPRAVEAMAQMIGPELRVIASELTKLALYRPNMLIRYSDVLDLVSYTKEVNIFAAVDAIIEGRSNVAIELVRKLIQLGNSPTYLLSMLARQVRLLILAKELRRKGVAHSELGQRIGLTGYPMRKTVEQEKRFSLQTLMKIHQNLITSDLNMKTSSVADELVLEVLIAEVSLYRNGRD